MSEPVRRRMVTQVIQWVVQDDLTGLLFRLRITYGGQSNGPPGEFVGLPYIGESDVE